MSYDHGPLRTYELTWRSGHIETVQGHQVMMDSWKLDSALDGSVTYLLAERMRRAPKPPTAAGGAAPEPERTRAAFGPEHADWMRTSQVREALGLKSDSSVKLRAADGRLRVVRLATGERLYDPASVERCKAAMNGGPK